MRSAVGGSGAALAFVVVFLLEIGAAVAVFLYLLDKGWGVILAAIITISVIGTVITTLYAAFGDGYWTPLVLMAGGIGIQVVGGAFLQLLED